MVSNPASALEGLLRAYASHRKVLWRIAMCILDSREMADDVVQDAMLKLWEQAWPESPREPLAYLCQTVRHLAIDRQRRRAFEHRLFTHEAAAEHVATDLSTEGDMQNRQAISLAADILTRVPTRTRQAFELHRFEGYTQRDVAREMGVSPASVNAMIRAAHGALRDCRELMHLA